MNNGRNTSDSKISSVMNDNKCPVCRGTGFELKSMSTEETRAIYGDDRLIEFAIPCSYCNGGHVEKVERMKERANTPSSFYDSTIEQFDWTLYQDNNGNPVNLEKQKQIVMTFIEKYDVWEKKGIGLYIYSHMKGSGKTFLASCICNELISRYPMVTKFVSASELIELSKKGSNDRYASEYDKDPIELLCNCKLLVIDDLGQKQSGSDWTNDILFRIMDNRMQKKLVTVITSNIPIQELQIDDRIVDRIYKICSPIPLPEFCVRSRESKQIQKELFQELGLIGKKVN